MSESIQAAERRAMLKWVALIVLLLGSQLAIGAAAVVLAVGDKSVAVVPDYHQRALDWDKTVEARAKSDALGWKATMKLELVRDAHGLQAISFFVTDRFHQPLLGAAGEIELYAHSRAGEVQRAAFRELGSGMYVAPTQFTRPGLWHLSLTLRRGDDETFLLEQDFDVPVEPVAPSIEGPPGAAP